MTDPILEYPGILCYCGGRSKHQWDPQGARRTMPCPTSPKLKPLPDERRVRRRFS